MLAPFPPFRGWGANYASGLGIDLGTPSPKFPRKNGSCARTCRKKKGLGGKFGHRYPSRARQARYRERLRGPSSNTTGTIPADEARAPQTRGLDGFSCLLPHAFGVWAHIGRCPHQVACAFGFKGRATNSTSPAQTRDQNAVRNASPWLWWAAFNQQQSSLGGSLNPTCFCPPPPDGGGGLKKRLETFVCFITVLLIFF